MDDRAARTAAKQKDLKVIGTLGVLKLAQDRRLIDLKVAVRKLEETNFRISKILLETLLNS